MKADRKAYQDQKQVQKLGNQRGDGSTGNAHSGGTQLSEDEQIVQPDVRRYRAKTCPKGDSGVFLAAQPCGQDGADRHGQIRERHDAEVPRPHTEDGVICRIKSQDLRREAPCRQQKQCCQHTPADKAYIQTAPRLGVLLRTQKLCDQKIQESELNYRKVYYKICNLIEPSQIAGGYAASYGEALASFAFLCERLSIIGLSRTLMETVLDKYLVRRRLSDIEHSGFAQP